MHKPACYTSSSIGPCPTLCDNFLQREETTSITWDDGFHFEDPSYFRTFHQCEPIEVFDIVDRIIAAQGHYDLILAWNERILDACPQARFITESACSWMDRKSHGSVAPFLHYFEGHGLSSISPTIAKYEACDVGRKKFQVAFITSSKRMFPGHRLRQEIYERLPERLGELSVWKHRSPPYLGDKREKFEESQYVITPENSRHNNYYSEKIVDCFIAKAIPVFWGCPNIGKHFNEDGIICFENCDEMLSKLKELTPEYYHSRREAIEENHQRALLGVHQWDLIENAISNGIAKKKETGSQHTDYAPPVVYRAVSRLNRPLRRV